jgi:hypothetical protein
MSTNSAVIQATEEFPTPGEPQTVADGSVEDRLRSPAGVGPVDEAHSPDDAGRQIAAIGG